ncbi:MAG: hypothetical protein JWO31_2659 [Phycisphaerales bacterium]|nr:hypothetical protein [Phycisphaerales bacterium]
MERPTTDSPFPGMDPYLEQPGRWRDFHVAFLTNLMAELNAGLPEPYTADIEESVQLVELDAPSLREAIPDGSVTRGPGPTVGLARLPIAAAAVFDPVVLTRPHAAEVKERWVEIRSSPGRELVAVIELLSPTNKGDGRTDSLQKRVALMRQQVHLVEVDLLLGGKRLPMVQPLPAGDYFAVVSRADRRPTGDVDGWPAPRRLPAIPIPLRPPDADHLVDLQAVFDATYRASAYRRKLDYARPPNAALPAALEHWVSETAGRAKATA